MCILVLFVGNIGKNKMIGILQNKEFYIFCRNPEKKDATQSSIYEPLKSLYTEIMEENPNYKSRSVAIVIRDGKILMERLCYKDANNGNEFFSIPGGGIEEGETPEQTALRELKEECGLDGTIVKPLAIIYSHGRKEYSFEVSVPEDQQAITGYDPEEAGSENPPLREVVWKSLNEISEKDRSFLWSYGLIQVQNFYQTIVGWGDEISYPGK